jgi:hypothetical protein
MPSAGEMYYNLIRDGWTLDGIAQQYRIKPASVQRTINLHLKALTNPPILSDPGARGMGIAKTPENPPQRVFYVEQPLSYNYASQRGLPSDSPTDDRRAAILAYLGTSLTLPPHAPTPETDARRIVAIGDLHGAPSAAMLAAVIRAKPDVVVIGGDLTNQQQASAHGFSRQDKQTTIRQELANVRAFIEAILLYLPDCIILIMRGNHDDWLMKKAADLLPAYLLEFVQDPFDVLMAGLPPERVELVKTEWQAHTPHDNPTEFGHSEYMLVLGDALFSHANFTAAQPGGAVTKLHNWLYGDKGWAAYLGLPRLPILCQFHGHKIADLQPQGGNARWFEPGMGCEPYVESYKAGYQVGWAPGALGALCLDQEYIDQGWRTYNAELLKPCSA